MASFYDLRCWAMTLFSRSCYGPFDANAHCCGSFQLFFDIHDKSSYPWRFKYIQQWIKYSRWTVTSVQVIWRHHVWCHHKPRKHLSITPRRVEIEPWAGCHCVCLVKTHRMIWNIIYLERLSGQVIWPGIRSDFQIDLSRSKCIYFDASWPEEYDSVSRFFFIFQSSKVIRKKLDLP